MQRRSADAVLRASQAYCTQLCDKHTFDFGIAYHCERYPNVPELQQFREVVLDQSADVVGTVRQVDDWFRARGLVCSRWAGAGGFLSPELAAHLIDSGFAPVRHAVLVLTRWVDVSMPSDVRVLPARAMRSAWTDLLSSETADLSEPARTQTLASRLDRLDSPQYDAFLAMVGGKPAGSAALFQVGDLAQVVDLFVARSFASTGAAEAVVRHALALAKRLMMRHNYAMVRADDAGRIALLRSLGFDPDGEIVEFFRDAASGAGASARQE